MILQINSKEQADRLDKISDRFGGRTHDMTWIAACIDEHGNCVAVIQITFVR